MASVSARVVEAEQRRQARLPDPAAMTRSQIEAKFDLLARPAHDAPGAEVRLVIGPATRPPDRGPPPQPHATRAHKPASKAHHPAAEAIGVCRLQLHVAHQHVRAELGIFRKHQSNCWWPEEENQVEFAIESSRLRRTRSAEARRCADSRRKALVSGRSERQTAMMTCMVCVSSARELCAAGVDFRAMLGTVVPRRSSEVLPRRGRGPPPPPRRSLQGACRLREPQERSMWALEAWKTLR